MSHKLFKLTTAILMTLLLMVSCNRLYDDALNIYFVRGGNIYQISESGTDLKPLLTAGAYAYPSSSPDGEKLICSYGASSAIYLLPHMTLYRILPANSPFTHSWSPDGTKVAFTDGPGTISVYEVSSGIKIWTSTVGGRKGFYFSNDSQYIIEKLISSTTVNEYLVPGDTVPERTRTLPSNAFDNLTLSPDGRSIAADDGISIYILDEATLSARHLGSGKEPSWSPDGETLVFNSGGNICLYDIATGAVQTLTSLGTDSYPCFQYKPR